MAEQYFNIVSMLGLDPRVFGMVLFYIVILATGILTYFYFANVLLAYIASFTSGLTLIFVGLVPLWLMFPLGMLCLGLIAYRLFMLEPREVEGLDRGDLDRWTLYGLRMKEAYAAKFGGENPGFNQEVDRRVDIVSRLRKGFTYTVAKDWLGRMEDFTEMRR